jgi:hypothetical protein
VNGAEFVSGRANSDGCQINDLFKNGEIIPLQGTVGLAADTTTVAFFIDVSCYAAVEKPQTIDSEDLQPFAQFYCSVREFDDDSWGYPMPPSRFRVRQMNVELCGFPFVHV